MSPGVSTAAAHQPKVRNPVGRFLFDHTIDVYPRGGKRVAYLALAVWATIVLYYTYYTQTGVVPNILASYHMTFAFYVGIVVVSNALGAFASLPASRTDRIGRTNVVIYGVLIIGLLMCIGVPNAHSEWSFAAVICAIGIVEGAILVATPALVRDFSPQMGRASAMGFWTIGPVAGSLIVAIIANHTLDHFGAAHWDSQFIISGLVALGTFVLALFLLKDLSPRLRDQLMVTLRDEALVEARARGLTDADVARATQRPWSQILKWDLVGSAFGISVFLLIYFVAASFFTIYYPTVFKNADGTQFTVSQANGLNQWFWGADIIALIVIGLLSDWLKVRKPFMLVGAFASMVMLLLFAQRSYHPHTSYSTLAFLSVLLAVMLGMVFAPWMAGYTESVEAKNPALVATGLALWGWIIRIIVAISFIFLPVVINTVNPIVDNLPIAQRVIHGQSIADWAATHPETVQFATANQAVLKPVQSLPASVQAGLCANPQSPAAVAYAASHLSGAEITKLLALQKELQAKVCPYPDQLAFLSAHQATLVKLNNAINGTAEQWRKWFLVDLIGMIVFVPLIWLTKGRWSPGAARRDQREHEQRVNEELARMLAQEKAPTGSP
jgi:MFS family permease